MTFLSTVVAFLIALGVLIAFHEYGHYLAARLCGVKVLRFCLGFGRPIFMRRFGMHIHVWRPIDSKFRLITARRNPNMIILLVALVFRRPDMGLELVALWTMISLIFHAVRLAQANARSERGRKLASWLA